MKAKLFFLLLPLALLMGCSTDAPIDASQTADATFTPANQRPFNVRGQGTFSMVIPPTECPDLLQIALTGTGNGTHVGLYSVSITWCTNFVDQSYMTGTMTAANGDDLYFYSVGFGEDENGEFGIYIFDGGSGRFENCYGVLTLYSEVVQTGIGEGTYSNYGEGYLIY